MYDESTPTDVPKTKWQNDSTGTGALGPAPSSVQTHYHNLRMQLLMLRIPDTPDQNLLFASIYCQSKHQAPCGAVCFITANLKAVYFIFC